MGHDLYCCYNGPPFPGGGGCACTYNASLDSSCGYPNSLGYSCAGGDDPSTCDSALACYPSPSGTGDFCCSMVTGTPPPGCVQDPSVFGCVGSGGYSCATGDPAPDVADPTLACSAPVRSGPDDLYCCYTRLVFPPGTCSYNPSLDGSCASDGLGYSCEGGYTPEQTHALLVCTPDPAGAGEFCCTIK